MIITYETKKNHSSNCVILTSFVEWCNLNAPSLSLLRILPSCAVSRKKGPLLRNLPSCAQLQRLDGQRGRLESKLAISHSVLVP